MKKLYSWLISLFAFGTGFLFCAGIDDSKYVRIKLDSKWSNIPILLEASEFVGSGNEKNFWKFVEKTEDAYKKETDLDLYNYIIEASRDIISPLEVDLLKLSLSTRALSPKLELFRQVRKELNIPNCDVVLAVQDTHYCSVEEMLTKIAKLNSVHLKFEYSFDHVYLKSETNPITVVVYGEIGTQAFNDAHKTLVDLSNQKRVKYIFRHLVKENGKGKVRLSGYGVELAIKSTEYKAVDDQKINEKEDESEMRHAARDKDEEVDGFLFGPLRHLYPDLKKELDSFKTHLKESNRELAPLKVWQLQDLSYQAAQRVMSSSPSEMLRVLKDLSQNLPLLARSLVKTVVKDDLKNEIKKNQKEFEKIDLSPGDSSLFVNGLQLQLESLDPFMLGNLLKDESRTMKKLDELGLQGEAAGDLVTLNVKASQERYVLDIRSSSVQWMNDLERDSQYSYWPSNIEEILRPTFPGMLRYIAKNIFHIVLCLDPTDPSSIQLFLNSREYVANSLPARFGILLIAKGDVKDDGKKKVAVGIVRAFSFIKADKDLAHAFDFLDEIFRKAGGQSPTEDDLETLFRKWYGKDDFVDALGPSSDYDDLRKDSYRFFVKSGLRHLPQALVNGVPLSTEEIQQFEGSIVEKMLMQTQQIQNAVFSGRIQGHTSIYDYVMTQDNVVKRLNTLVQTTDGEYISFSKEPIDAWAQNISQFKRLEPKEMFSALSKRIKYFLGDKGALTAWVFADANTEDGRALLRASMAYLQGNSNVRLAIVVYEPSPPKTTAVLTVNQIIQTVIQLRDKLVSGVSKFLLKLLNETNNYEKLASDVDAIVELSKGITGINKSKLKELLLSKDKVAEVTSVLDLHNVIVKSALKYPDMKAAVVANGRLIGPLGSDDFFTEDDFHLLQNFELDRSGSKLDELVERMELSNLPPDNHDRYKSDLVMKINAILSNREQRTRQTVNFYGNKHSVINLKPQKQGVSYDIVAILDPLTAESQKLVPVLTALYNVTNVNLKVFMNCKEKLSEMPLKRFYRYVLEPQMTFDSNGSLINAQQALFMGMPQSAILTLNMDTPQSWMVEAVRSPYDLDNIHLAEVEQGVFGDFELEYILVEGHCVDTATGSPPRGLQFTLGTSSNPVKFDTIVMANLGYFQLKAYPGNFVIKLRQGRSSDIYLIDSLFGGDKHTYDDNFSLTIDSFGGRFLKVKVLRKPGKENEDLLSGAGEGESQGLWNSFTSYVSGEKKEKPVTDTVHVFSVATGLLYERMLRIMMLSVIKNTKSNVKFWFLKNYLSPTFTSFLPHMAKEYKFDYELVQYQWPRWLNRQKDKQRIIWGYKILFLDVLFPLNIDRVIFVDADQIVRTDLKQLMEMDLEGAPYAYTPFCSDRTDMDGFRFWKTGYWKSHLAGRPYHISALYVVDLRTFRRIAAGDRLRGQYQGLSQDPNSLANLDQDLPNNMIHQVPIKSLPQEWLWCETWCSDASKKNAKTIDLCNNPKTKEPKLERAVRIVEEWPNLDDEIRALQQKVVKQNGINNIANKKDGHAKKEEL